MTDLDAGKRLIAKLTELQAMFAHLRSYSGPFDPQFPRTIFHLLFCPPLHCSIDPVETFGVIQRIFHSKDGKYLAVSFSKQARFWRENAMAEDRRAVAVLREIREIAQRHKIWATYADKDGSWFPEYSFLPGMLNEPPGEPMVVPAEKYLDRLREYDLTDPPTPGTLLSTSIDMHDITRVVSNSELVSVMPDECRVCAPALTERNAKASVPIAGYMRDTRQCPSCRTIYVREPTDEELTPEEAEKRDVRQADMAEFMRRIDEEFEHLGKRSSSGDELTAQEDEDPYGLFNGLSFDKGDESESWKGEG